MTDTFENLTLLKNFLDYYEYNVVKLNTAYLPKQLINVFHKFNAGDSLYSGSGTYRQIPFISDWTTDYHTAKSFAADGGFVVEISKDGFVEKFNFISMDIIYDYLVCRICEPDNIRALESYVSESEVYVIELK